MTVSPQTNWDQSTGLICPSCDQERFQFPPDSDGRCMRCVREGWAKDDAREKKVVKEKAGAKKHGLWVYSKGKKERPPR